MFIFFSDCLDFNLRFFLNYNHWVFIDISSISRWMKSLLFRSSFALNTNDVRLFLGISSSTKSIQRHVLSTRSYLPLCPSTLATNSICYKLICESWLIVSCFSFTSVLICILNRGYGYGSCFAWLLTSCCTVVNLLTHCFFINIIFIANSFILR